MQRVLVPPVRRASVLPRSLVAAGLSLLVATPALGQLGPGNVLTHRKLSRTVGGPPSPNLRPVDQFGRSVTQLGDLDGDGDVDLAIGAHGDDAGEADDPSYGALWITRLRDRGRFEALTKIGKGSGGFTGTLDPGDGFGRACAGIGDFDRDGVVDVAVGANRDDDGARDAGAIYLLFLNPDGTVKSHVKISSTQGGFGGQLDPGDEFGRAVAPLGDLDGDGVEDLVVGAANDDDGAQSVGALWVLFLNRNGTVKAEQKISLLEGGLVGPMGDNWSFGMSVTNLGDLDGDGVVDIGVGSIGESTGGPTTGGVWNLFLNPDGTVRDQAHINNNQVDFRGQLTTTDEFGFGVAGLGDLDGDGVGDMAVGAILDDDGGKNRGALWILFLRPDGTPKSFQKISDTEGNFTGVLDNGDWWGTSVAALDDVDGDGVRDIAAGARFDDDGGSALGAVWLLFPSDGSAAGLVSEFRSDVRQGTYPLDVHFLDQTYGNASSWLWTFGDGATSTEEHPTHTYTRSGLFTVSLDVAGPGGTARVEKTSFVRVDGPGVTASFDPEPPSGPAPLDVFFRDASYGSLEAWSWDFGDGATSTRRNPTHTFTTPGVYDVVLTVTGLGRSDVTTRTVTVTGAGPVAAFTNDPASGTAPLQVAFTDLSIGDVQSWAWDFGDGSTSTAASPSHAYVTPGTYDVSLTVSGADGSDTALVPGAVRVVATGAPVAAFSADPTEGARPLAVSFADLSTGQVDAWSWDFGDGASSTAASPQHVYSTPGTYDVSLLVTGPGGEDTLLQPGLVRVLADVPVAAFQAAPTEGIAPLPVSFTDLSTGTVTTWSWDFGDGEGSSLAAPLHVYAAPGTYTVQLAVSGPGGEDSSLAPGLVRVLPPGTGLVDGSFELQTADAAPGAPWVPDAGSDPFVHSKLSAAELGLPSAGNQWLELSAAGSTAAVPPDNPRGITLPGSGALGIAQAFSFSSATPLFALEASFLRDGAAASTEFDDWAAVDVTDGVTTWNLYYADTFTPTPFVSTIYGLSMTDVETVEADLEVLFPGIPEGTPLTVRAEVGNGGDGLFPSRLYLDHVRLRPRAPGPVEVYGCEVNPAGSLSLVSGAPVLGGTLVFGVHNPLGTQAAGSVPVLVACLGPAPEFPCGTLRPGWNMVAGAPGELLVDLVAPNPVLRLVGAPWSGSPVEMSLTLPVSTSFAGVQGFVQGVLLDGSTGALVPRGLTEARSFVMQP